MLKDDSLKDFILDQLNGLSEVMASSMFSSWGLYSDNVFFGIINNGHLYFKTNEVTSQKYKDQGMKAFQPSAKQKLKNYFEVPGDIIENSDELLRWTKEAISVWEKDHEKL